MKRSTSTRILTEKELSARRLNWEKFCKLSKVSDGSGWTMVRVTRKERDTIRNEFGVCHDGIVRLCSMITKGEVKKEVPNG